MLRGKRAAPPAGKKVKGSRGQTKTCLKPDPQKKEEGISGRLAAVRKRGETRSRVLGKKFCSEMCPNQRKDSTGRETSVKKTGTERKESTGGRSL